MVMEAKSINGLVTMEPIKKLQIHYVETAKKNQQKRNLVGTSVVGPTITDQIAMDVVIASIGETVCIASKEKLVPVTVGPH